MIKTYSVPLKIDIVNKSDKEQGFVPYRQNELFNISADGKVSFTVDRVEKALYYAKQASNDLVVSLNDSNCAVQDGSYDLSSSTFSNSSSYSSILKSISTVTSGDATTNTFNYEVIGTLAYSDATPAIGMPAGNRFTARLSNSAITSKDSLPGGKICNVTKVGGQNSNNDYTKSAFEEDGSLILIVNSEPTSTITVTIDWTSTQTCVYVFTFTDVKLGTSGATIQNVDNIEIAENQVVTISNSTANKLAFQPYHENFSEVIASGDTLQFTTKISEETMYYLLLTNLGLQITL